MDEFRPLHDRPNPTEDLNSVFFGLCRSVCATRDVTWPNRDQMNIEPSQLYANNFLREKPRMMASPISAEQFKCSHNTIRRIMETKFPSVRLDAKFKIFLAYTSLNAPLLGIDRHVSSKFSRLNVPNIPIYFRPRNGDPPLTFYPNAYMYDADDDMHNVITSYFKPVPVWRTYYYNRYSDNQDAYCVCQGMYKS